MKTHPVFGLKYSLWWIILISIIFLKHLIFGLESSFKINPEVYSEYSYTFWVIAYLCAGLVYSIPFYLLLRLLIKKNREILLMSLISFFVVFTLLYVHFKF